MADTPVALSPRTAGKVVEKLAELPQRLPRKTAARAAARNWIHVRALNSAQCVPAAYLTGTDAWEDLASPTSPAAVKYAHGGGTLVAGGHYVALQAADAGDGTPTYAVLGDADQVGAGYFGGLVSTTTQTFKGAKKFRDDLTVQSDAANAGRVLLSGSGGTFHGASVQALDDNGGTGYSAGLLVTSGFSGSAVVRCYDAGAADGPQMGMTPTRFYFALSGGIGGGGPVWYYDRTAARHAFSDSVYSDFGFLAKGDYAVYRDLGGGASYQHGQDRDVAIPDGSGGTAFTLKFRGGLLVA